MGKQSNRRNANRLAKEMLEASRQTMEDQELPEISYQPVQEQQPKPQPMQQPDPVSSEKSTKPQKKRITFDVDPELHVKTCLYASRQGTTIKDLLTAFLERETINEKI